MPREDERLRQHAFVAGSVGADVQFGPVAEEHRGGGIPVERRAVIGGCHHDAVGLLCQRLSQGRVCQVQRHSESATTTVLQPDQAVGLHRAVGLGREVPACEGADPVVPGGNEQRRGSGSDSGHPVGQRRLLVAVHAVWPGVDRRRRGHTEERPDCVDHVFEHGVQRREIVGERGGQAHRSGAARDDLLVRGGVQPVLRRLRGSSGIEIIDPAGAQVVDGRGAAGRGEPGDQLEDEVDDRVDPEHRVDVRPPDQYGTVEHAGPGAQQLVGGGAEVIPRLRGRGDLVDRDGDDGGVQGRDLGIEGAIEGAVGDTVEHHHTLEVGVL